MEWLTHGDKNTYFFHLRASRRRRKNKIKALLRDDGSLTEETGEMEEMVNSFYVNLYTSEGVHDMERVIGTVPRKVTDDMNAQLNAPYSQQEVKDPLFHMFPMKSPGPDGFPAHFFQRHWDVCGETVTRAVLAIVRGDESPACLNDTLLVLIPKVSNPTLLSQFRPISLCNVFYKIASKVLANRLKVILPDIISHNQSEFIPGRMISDIIILAYELTHFLQNKRSGKNGYAALKLDMSKAYDRVEWCFLQDMMRKMGFERRWIHLIMKCVMTVRYQVKLNHDVTETIIPPRGLRQGVPLSPYLFIICAEGFSALLHEAERHKRIEGIKVSIRAPSVNHLLFADDSLLLIKAVKSNAQEVDRILNIYAACSVQIINNEKSAIMFSPNTEAQAKQQVKGETRIASEEWNDRYLGLPVHVGRSRKRTFAYLKRNVCGRFHGWKERLLAKSGKETIVKSGAQAIPAFAMSFFDLTAPYPVFPVWRSVN